MNAIEASVVIVDDDPDVLLSARLYLEQYFQHVVALDQPTDLLPTVTETSAHVVLLDMNYKRGRNDGSEGLHWLKQIRDHAPNTEVIVMTAYAEVGLAVEAIQAGAADFVVKPWSNEKLLATVMSAARLSKSRKEVAGLQRERSAWQDDTHREAIMIGDSQPIQRIREVIQQVAPTDANVLVLGENGTGKEIVARMIHQQSLRASSAFVKVDLGAVHEGLFESEVFGAKKGAYTDLKHDKPGRFELASGGTLFLDEIGNLSPALQAKLLSTLEQREIIPVGSTNPVSIDVRLVSATNANLHQQALDGGFRQDLLYRINTIEIEVPPLRERIEDLPLLANHFLERYASKYRKKLQLPVNALRKLMSYEWPGNVREFQHAMERAIIMNTSGKLASEEILPSRSGGTKRSEVPTRLDELERWQVERVMEKHQGNISRAAEDLGITRAALYRRLEKHEL